MATLIKTELKKDTTNNCIYEVLTFSNKVQKSYYSKDLHTFNFLAAGYGLNIENYKDFLFIENIFLTQNL